MPKPLATAVISLLIITFYALEMAVPGFVDVFSLSGKEVLQKPWTLVTHIFLHDPAGFNHIFYNLFGLVIFGMVLESIIGTRRFAMLFFAAGITSGLAGMLFYDSIIGASGAIFGIMGALAVLRPKDMVWVMGIPVPMFIALIIWIAIDAVGFFVPDGIAHASHLMGLGVGIIYGFAVRRIYFNDSHRKKENTLKESEMQEWERNWMK